VDASRRVARSEVRRDETRLLCSVADNRALPIDELAQAVVDAAVAFGAGEESDDITVVALRAE
jgi:hypothetical protein